MFPFGTPLPHPWWVSSLQSAATANPGSCRIRADEGGKAEGSGYPSPLTTSQPPSQHRGLSSNHQQWPWMWRQLGRMTSWNDGCALGVLEGQPSRGSTGTFGRSLSSFLSLLGGGGDSIHLWGSLGRHPSLQKKVTGKFVPGENGSGRRDSGVCHAFHEACLDTIPTVGVGEQTTSCSVPLNTRAPVPLHCDSAYLSMAIVGYTISETASLKTIEHCRWV